MHLFYRQHTQRFSCSSRRTFGLIQRWKFFAHLLLDCVTKCTCSVIVSRWLCTPTRSVDDIPYGRAWIMQSSSQDRALSLSRSLCVSASLKYRIILTNRQCYQGDYSVRVEALDDSQIQTEVLGVLQAMFPNSTIPAPLAFSFPRWHQDPLFRGSCSNWPPSFTSGHHQNLKATVEQRLWFAGEATSMKYFGA